MTAYYNEHDPYAAEWLRNLIREGLIAPGDVDERSIVEVHPDDLRGYTQCHFFAGVGGWSLALRFAGWSDDRAVWSGSCPCQPFSSAGRQGGENDERHLWPEMRRLVSECHPPVVFGEQVASHLGRGWLSGVRADLEALGYAVGAADLCAAGVGAPHIRQRLWWVADAGYGAGARGNAGSDSAQGGGGWQSADTPRRGGEDGGVADADVAGFGAGGRCGLHRAREAGAFASLGSGGLGDADHTRLEGLWREYGLHKSSGEGEVRGSSHAGGLAHAGRERRDGEHARLRAEDGRRESTCTLSETAGRGEHGGWDSALWLPCADGKARRIEPGLEPLAHGVPNRVGRLRAYGNAIVPQVAAAFIRAYLESI